MDVMLDLETFSTAPNAAIVQIGACFFDPVSTEIGDKFAANVNLASSLMLGLHVDPNTVEWWSNREHGHLMANPKPLAFVVSMFRDWFLSGPDGKEANIWSHGAAFDVPVLDSSYRACGIAVPWGYRHVRDTRTLFALALDLGWEKPDGKEPAHEGLADAVAQAILVQDAMKKVLNARG